MILDQAGIGPVRAPQMPQQHRRAGRHAQNIGAKAKGRADDQIMDCPERCCGQQQTPQGHFVGLHAANRRQRRRSRREERWLTLPGDCTRDDQQRHQREIYPAKPRPMDEHDRNDGLHAHDHVHRHRGPVAQQRVMQGKAEIVADICGEHHPTRRKEGRGDETGHGDESGAVSHRIGGEDGQHLVHATAYRGRAGTEPVASAAAWSTFCA
jgi:hypothetical protein